jgi:hypothetical protein
VIDVDNTVAGVTKLVAAAPIPVAFHTQLFSAENLSIARILGIPCPPQSASPITTTRVIKYHDDEPPFTVDDIPQLYDTPVPTNRVLAAIVRTAVDEATTGKRGVTVVPPSLPPIFLTWPTWTVTWWAQVAAPLSCAKHL